MKEWLKNFIEIIILIIIGGSYGFMCSQLIHNPWVSISCALAGGCLIGWVLGKLFVWLRNRQNK